MGSNEQDESDSDVEFVCQFKLEDVPARSVRKNTNTKKVKRGRESRSVSDGIVEHFEKKLKTSIDVLLSEMFENFEEVIRERIKENLIHRLSDKNVSERLRKTILTSDKEGKNSKAGESSNGKLSVGSTSVDGKESNQRSEQIINLDPNNQNKILPAESEFFDFKHEEKMLSDSSEENFSPPGHINSYTHKPYQAQTSYASRRNSRSDSSCSSGSSSSSKKFHALLTDPKDRVITFLPGVGPKTGNYLKDKGIDTVGKLYKHYQQLGNEKEFVKWMKETSGLNTRLALRCFNALECLKDEESF